jgi:CheY-like chemotaxis protein
MVQKKKEPIRVLICDDDVFLAGIYRAKLNQAGFETVISTDPSDIMSKAKQWQPDIIISEAEVGGINGIELVRRLTTTGGLAMDKTCFVFLTRIPLEDSHDLAEKMGVRACLLKTKSTFDEVVTKVFELMREPGARLVPSEDGLKRSVTDR